MGRTFSVMLIQRHSDESLKMKRFKDCFRKQGYVQTRGKKDSEHYLRLYGDDKDSWMILASDLFGDGVVEDDIDTAKNLAIILEAHVIVASVYDSDELFLSLTDGSAVEKIVCNLSDDDDTVRDEDLVTPMWDSILNDDTRESFKDILSRSYDEIEEVLSELAKLLGWSNDILKIPLGNQEVAACFIKPVWEIYLKHKKDSASFLMRSDAPPALMPHFLTSDRNPSFYSAYSVGGEGKGLIVEMKAEGYDAEQYEILECWLRMDALEAEYRKNHRMQIWERVPSNVYIQFSEAQRTVFEDGNKGWTVYFPEATIPRGIDMSHKPSMRRDRYASEHSVIFYAAIKKCEDVVCDEYGKVGISDELSSELWYESGAISYRASKRYTSVIMRPLENSDSIGGKCKWPLYKPDECKALIRMVEKNK